MQRPRSTTRALVALAACAASAVSTVSAQVAQRIYVDAAAPPGGSGTSWETAVSDLRAALSLATADSNELWIADGVYTAVGSSFVVPPNTTLLGGFAGGEMSSDARNWTQHPAMLTGGGVFSLVSMEGEPDAPAVLDGLRITGGGDYDMLDFAGGVLVEGRAELRNCTIQGCGADVGGGVGVRGGARLDMFGCTVRACSARIGVGLAVDGHLEMFDCIVEDNSPDYYAGIGRAAGGAAVVSGTLVMQRCTVRGNHGNGYTDDGYYRGSFAAGIWLNGGTFLGENCLFTENHDRALGTVMSIWSGDARFVNCTIAGNTGDGYTFDGGPITVENCIIWGNEGHSSGLVTVGRNITEADGTLDPLLDASYRPMSGSPAIDAGDNAALVSSTDVLGLPRFVDDCATPDSGAGSPPFVDLGAFEYQDTLYAGDCPPDCDDRFRTPQGGLAAYWTFTQNVTPLVDDYAGYDGINDGAAWAAGGRVGGAARFDGINDFMDISNPALNVPTWPECTIAVWFRNDGGGRHAGYGQKIFDKSTWYSDFCLRIDPAGFLHFWSGSPGNPWAGIEDRSRDYRDDQWHQAVIVKRGPHGELWVDGVLKGASEDLGSPDNSQPFLLGYSLHDDRSQQTYWSGLIDELAIFDRGLSEADITDLYAASTAGETYCFQVQQGACCLPDGTCWILTATACAAAGGAAQPYGTSCETADCQNRAPVGACCVSTGCLIETEPSCTSLGGVYQGHFTACDADSDGVSICEDECPNDAAKTSPGICGCETPESSCVPTCDDRFQDGMSAYWRFDQSAAPLVDHYAGVSGVNLGATWTADGRIGGAMSFDGADYVLIPPRDVPMWPRCTIAVWFRNDGGGNHGVDQWIFARNGDVIGGHGDSYVFSLSVQGPTGLLYFWDNYDYNDEGITDQSRNYRDNQWHHAVAVRDGRHSELWVDGVLKGAFEQFDTPENNNGDWPTIGALWSGLIDEFAVFNRALTPAEVVDLYTISAGGMNYCGCTTLVISTHPEPQTICASGSASFTVVAEGTSPFTYQWRRGAVPIDPATNPSAATPTLILGNLQTADDDLYDCIVTDWCGSVVTSNPARLTICHADWNCDAALDSQDFFDFLEAFFFGYADFNGADGTDSQDYFEFLEAYASGC